MRRLSLPTILKYSSVVAGAGFGFSILIAVAPVWWLFDLFSHFSIQYVLAGFLLLPVLLWLKKYLVAGLATIAIVIHSFAIWPYLQANVPSMNVQAVEHSATGMKVLFGNVYYKSTNIDSVEALIKKNNPDVMIFAELNYDNYDELVRRMGGVYKYHDFRDGDGAYDMSFFSKEDPLPEVMYFSNNNPSWWLTFEAGGQKMRILGIHPHSPTSKSTTEERNVHLANALAFVSESPDPVMVIGDFNISQFSKTFQNLIEKNNLIDTQEEFGLQPSWHAQMPSLFRIPIDQVLVNDKVVVLDRYVSDFDASDHFPVVAVVDW